ncbi:MAG: glycosyltransferase, partial [Lachnospiraceae bacterium]|nr:glycosyltransferase [Lachnospiraceae bacterium]
MQDLITVIVAVYKTEPYIRRCLDSIVSQTYKNMEVLLIDDGSPDGAPAISDEYAEK